MARFEVVVELVHGAIEDVVLIAALSVRYRPRCRVRERIEHLLELRTASVEKQI